MGAWDYTAFGNDTACDWIYELEQTDDLSYIERTLDRVLEQGKDYLEAPEADEGIAATETLTRLRGKGGESTSYTETLDSWVAEHPLEIPEKLIEKGNKVIHRVTSEPSELLELWKETDDYEAWKEYLADLQKRLNG